MKGLIIVPFILFLPFSIDRTEIYDSISTLDVLEILMIVALVTVLLIAIISKKMNMLGFFDNRFYYHWHFRSKDHRLIELILFIQLPMQLLFLTNILLNLSYTYRVWTFFVLFCTTILYLILQPRWHTEIIYGKRFEIPLGYLFQRIHEDGEDVLKAENLKLDNRKITDKQNRFKVFLSKGTKMTDDDKIPYNLIEVKTSESDSYMNNRVRDLIDRMLGEYPDDGVKDDAFNYFEVKRAHEAKDEDAADGGAESDDDEADGAPDDNEGEATTDAS